MQTLERLVVDLAEDGGRKAVLFISDGLPLRPGDEVYQALDGTPGPSRAADLSEEMDLLVKAANANRVSFYTLSSGGPGVSIVGASASNPFGPSKSSPQLFKLGPVIIPVPICKFTAPPRTTAS